MTDADRRERLRWLVGSWLSSEQAAEAQALAAALGVELKWDRAWLNPSDEEKARQAKKR